MERKQKRKTKQLSFPIDEKLFWKLKKNAVDKKTTMKALIIELLEGRYRRKK